MKAISRYVSLISVTSLLAGGALVAQTSGSASGSSGTSGATTSSDASHSGTTATRPYNSTNSARSNSVSNPALNTNDPSGPTRSSAIEPAGTNSSSARASTGYDGTTSGAGATNGATVTGSASAATSAVSGPTLPGTSNGLSTHSTAPGSLDPEVRVSTGAGALAGMTDPLATTLQSGDYSSRAQVTSEIEQRIDTQKDALKILKTDGKRLQGQAQSDFNSAYDDLEARAKDLRRSLREARNASPDKWESARAELAANYQAYNAALARAQIQVGPSVSFPGSSNSSSDMNRSIDSSTSQSRPRNATGTSSGDPTLPSTR